MTLRKSFFWTSTQFLAVLIIELGGLAVLARLLSPADMGAFAAAFALFRFAQFLGGFGLHTVVVRAKQVDIAFRRQVLGIALTSTVLVVLAYIIGFWAIPPSPDSEIYRTILLLMLPITLIHCFSMPTNALMVRDMRFRDLFVIRAISTIAYQLVAIPLAWSGVGPASLAFGMMASSASFMVGAFIATNSAFLVWPSLRGARDTTKFASVLFATNAVTEGREASVVMLVGRLAGLAPLGVLSRARDLVFKANGVISDTIMPVIVPQVFRAARDGADLRQNFLTGWTYLSAITLAAGIGLAFLAKPIVAILLGDQWDEVGVILSILALGIMFQPLQMMTSAHIVAMGGEMRRLALAVVNLCVSVVVVIALAGDGLVDLAVALVLIHAFDLCVLLVLFANMSGLRLRSVFAASWRSALMGAATGLPIYALNRQSPGLADVWFIILGFALGVAGWALALILTRHPFVLELGVLRSAIARRRAGRS